jgi:hypothetical protein
LVEDLEEDYALASEAAGEEDEDFAGGQGGSGFVWSLGFASLSVVVSMCNSIASSSPRNVLTWCKAQYTHLLGYRLILCWVVFEGLIGLRWYYPLAFLELFGLRFRLSRRHFGRLQDCDRQ